MELALATETGQAIIDNTKSGVRALTNFPVAEAAKRQLKIAAQFNMLLSTCISAIQIH